MYTCTPFIQFDKSLLEAKD